MRTALFLLAGTILAILLVRSLALRRGATGARAALRAAYLDHCAPLFDDLRRGRSLHGFARINGRYRGRLFDVQVVPDTLTYRKLPTLWLLVTIPAPMPVRATLDFLVRPMGGEVFSNFANLPVQIDTPQGFPADTAVRTDDPQGLPPESLSDALRTAFFSERVKELVLSPKGLRIVWLAEEADRAGYLLFRDAEMGRIPLSAQVLQPILDRLAGLADGVEKALSSENSA